MNIKALCLAWCLIPSVSMALPEIIINKATQSYEVINAGAVIKTGKVSTGKKGHSTPSGRFTVHTKQRKVKSIKYNAMMNYSLFFIKGLYAIHQGKLPGYPASHGCIRVSQNDAQYLFSILPIGSTVVIK